MSGLDDLSAFLAGQRGPESGGTPETLAETAFVTAVTPGAAKGGRTLLRIAWRGGIYTAQYVDSYTNPAVGDQVLLLHHADVPYILGRLTGLPT